MPATPTAPHKGKGRAPARPAANTSSKSRIVLPIALALFAVLAVIAVLISRSGGSDDSTTDAGDGTSIEETRPVEVTGSDLPAFEGANDAAAGAAAPVASGKTFAGAPVQIGGKEAQLVFFVAHWCPHCRNEVPVIVKWLEENGAPKGVRLKAVSTGVNPDAPNYPPSRWLDREEWPVITLADDQNGSTARAYGLSGYPFFVAIDADGKVVARASGELGIDQVEALVAAAKG